MYFYVVNPAAGGGKIDKIQEKLKSRLRELGVMGEFAKSTGPEDVAKLTRMAIDKGYKTIVAVGGDGTINEVMNQLVGNEKTVLGIIPIGSTNDLADTLGIKSWYQATGVLASRKVESVGIGLAGKRYFVTSIALGFDADIFSEKRLSKGNIFEKFNFGIKVFSKSLGFNPTKVWLRFDNNYEVEAEIFSIIISGSNSFINSAIKAESNASMLNTVIITKIPGYKILKYGYLSDPASLDSSKFSLFKSKSVEIHTKKPISVAIDGQIASETPIKIKMTENKLRVIVSRKRKI